MPTIFTKDALRASVEASTGGKVTVLYDDKGYPSYMYIIPAFNLQDIDPSLGTGLHPAFSVGGVQKSQIFIGQFQAKVIDGRAVSLPGVDPTVYVTYDQAVSYCAAKGSGFHLMTAWEWSAVALWCMKNGFQSRGNSYWGRSHELSYETGARVDGVAPGTTSGTGRVLTGSGPSSWRHDNTYAGLADLVGNIWEWQYGLKIIDGRIYCTTDNNFTLPESSWKATDVFVDSTATGDQNSSGDIGDCSFANSVSKFAGPVGDNNYYGYLYMPNWTGVPVTATGQDLNMLKQMLVVPTLTSSGQLLNTIKGAIWVRNYGERMALRGGHWYGASDTGLAALRLHDDRSYSNDNIGFRLAFTK